MESMKGKIDHRAKPSQQTSVVYETKTELEVTLVDTDVSERRTRTREGTCRCA